MNVQDLSKMLCESLRSHTIIKIETDSTISVTGDNLEEISHGLQEKDTIINKAGIYILGNETEILYIGEGGPSKIGDGGTMGHRVYHHLGKKIGVMK